MQYKLVGSPIWIPPREPSKHERYIAKQIRIQKSRKAEQEDVCESREEGYQLSQSDIEDGYALTQSDIEDIRSKVIERDTFKPGTYGVQIGRIDYPEYSFYYTSKGVKYYVKKPRENFHLSLFPGNLRASLVKMLHPNILDNGYRWRYHVESPVTALWIQIHLLKRILELPMWDRIDAIPLHFQYVSTEHKKTVENAIRGVNLGRRMPAIPPPTKYPLEEIHKFILHQNPYDVNWNLPDTIPKRQYINWIRHRLTPYDYLWQTGVAEYEEAKEGCNNLVKKTYPELF